MRMRVSKTGGRTEMWPPVVEAYMRLPWRYMVQTLVSSL
jgi:hypothetical protein